LYNQRVQGQCCRGLCSYLLELTGIASQISGLVTFRLEKYQKDMSFSEAVLHDRKCDDQTVLERHSSNTDSFLILVTELPLRVADSTACAPMLLFHTPSPCFFFSERSPLHISESLPTLTLQPVHKCQLTICIPRMA
jgi:hypothetical protein